MSVSYDTTAEQVIQSYLLFKRFTIPKHSSIGTLAMIYEDLKEVTDDEEMQTALLTAIDTYVHDVKETIDIEKLSKETGKSIVFINSWFDECKWRDIVDSNLTSNENTAFTIYVDMEIIQ